MIKSVLKLSVASLAVVATGAASGGCLRRDVSPNEPTTKVNVNTRLKQQAVDKIDLLLAIDNSSSMGDKQTFLAQAVPVLVQRLVTPNCVDAEGNSNGASTLDPTSGEGVCPDGFAPEFKTITDIHVGIVSSSLGNFGNDGDDAVCTNQEGKIVSDNAALLDRVPSGESVNIQNGNFLAWFPDVEKNKGKTQADPKYGDPGQFGSAFASLVKGVGENGCGLEAQLESMYQFLIAPQPWKEIGRDGARAVYSGINEQVLQQRHDFLRPDSLVAVIMLTDEDDSSVDPLSVGGTGHYFMAQNFPQPEGTSVVRSDQTTTAARGTSACADDPASPDCTSCAFAANDSKVAADPNCQGDGAYYAADDDDLNVRFFHMKQRYGVDPQYSVTRYVRGLSSPAISGRDKENHNGQPDDNQDCVNPLFFGDELPTTGTDDAAGLQALCKLQGSSEGRDPNLVFFALVGGVPNELIDAESGTRDSNGNITSDAWTKIVGSDPLAYNYDGQDPRMVQSIDVRPGRPGADSPDAVDPDPLNKTHRDWNTQKRDLQYACTFPIPTNLQRGASDNSDCQPFATTPTAIPSDAPLCEPVTDPKAARVQIRAKAYPTVREALVVRLLGTQGILGSLCPKVTEAADTTDPDFGYNPAVNEIVDRLKNALTQTCLPQPLTKADDGTVPCLMLELMPEDVKDCSLEGRSDPDPDVVAKFKDPEAGNVSDAQQGRTVCALGQNPSADTVAKCQSGQGDASGWCYLDGENAGRCSQQVVFNDRVLALAKGSTVFLQCINQLTATPAATGDDTAGDDDDTGASSSSGN